MLYFVVAVTTVKQQPNKHEKVCFVLPALMTVLLLFSADGDVTAGIL